MAVHGAKKGAIPVALHRQSRSEFHTEYPGTSNQQAEYYIADDYSFKLHAVYIKTGI